MNIYAITDGSGSDVSKYDINQKLEDMGIPTDVIDEGESAIEKYADENSIDLTKIASDEAKQNPVAGSNVTSKDDNQKDLELLGIPADVISQGQNAVKIYAEQNNIKLPEQAGNQVNFLS